MGIKRNKVAEPHWHDMDYAEASKHGVFSREGWNRTVEWNILLEHAKRTQGLCHLLFENTYPSSLFLASVELLEANLYVFGDLFYWLTGLNANTLDDELTDEALSRIWFWNMRCYKDLRQIQHELEKIESLFIEGLKQGSLWDDLKEDPIWNSDELVSLVMKEMNAPVLRTEEKDFARHRAFTYVQERYKVPQTDKADLAQRIVNILQLTHFFLVLLGACGSCIKNDFSEPLSLFRKSEIIRSRYIKPWERYFNGTRDSLIEKMRNNPDLAPWVDRYICLEGERRVIGRIFCEELYGSACYPIRKEMEEDFYNPIIWIRLMTIAAVLQEYDEQHSVIASESEKENEILGKLFLYFKDEDAAKRFYNSARQMNDKEIIILVKKYRDAGLCNNTSIDLWRVLYDAKLYKPKYKNWNAQLNL